MNTFDDLTSICCMSTQSNEYIKHYLAPHNSRLVAVIRGGFIDLEAAESLPASGVQLSIIEYMPHVLSTIDQDIAEPLHSRTRSKEVNLHLSTRIKEITHASGPMNTSKIVLEFGGRIEAHIILLVFGVHSTISLAQQIGLECNSFGVVTNEFMQTTDADIYAVGKMACTTNMATKFKHNLALAGPASRQRQFWDMNCRVFGLNIAIVGPSIKNLLAQDLTPKYIIVHSPNHAAYYPGSNVMAIKLAFPEPDGKEFGAQIPGKDGVDKLIDVIATCMQAWMTLFDLEHLELAHAPAFGSAKDPVSVTGLVACNMLRNDVEIVHPEDLT